MTTPAGGGSAAELDEVRRRLPGYLAAIGVAPEEIEDLAQETVTRLLRVRHRLADDVVLSFALVTARNLASSARRSHGIAERALPGLVDLAGEESAAERVERLERERAVRAALAALDEHDRALLVAHELHGETTAALGDASGRSPAAVAMQLARVRARARLDYVLALRRVELPSPRCRPVLLAISAGDRRRQRETKAAEHLVACEGCEQVAPPLLTRRLSLAVLWPFGFFAAWALARRWWAQPRTARAVQAGAVGLVAASTTLVVTSTHPRQPSSALATLPPSAVASAPEPSPTPSARPTATYAAGFVARDHVGSRVVLSRARVTAVPADEGFWVGADGAELWVQIVTRAATESPDHVRAGDLVDVVGDVVANTAGYPAASGLSQAEGRQRLVRAGAHLVVDASSLRLAH